MSKQANHQLHAGQYFGSVTKRRQVHGAVMSELKHTQPRALPVHSHELGYFSLFLNGDYEEWYGKFKVTHQPMTLMWHPATLRHQDAIGQRGCHFFNAEISANWLERLRDCSEIVSDPFVLPQSDAGWVMMRLYREFGSASNDFAAEESSARAMEGLLLELLAALARRPFPVEKQKPFWLRRVEAKLHDEFTRKLAMDELAAEAGVHPAHLALVFRRFHHGTIAEYVQQLRVEAARELLRKPDTPMAEIALQLGFADQSHLSRVFRRWTGMTPKTWRMSATTRGSFHE